MANQSNDFLTHLLERQSAAHSFYYLNINYFIIRGHVRLIINLGRRAKRITSDAIIIVTHNSEISIDLWGNNTSKIYFASEFN